MSLAAPCPPGPKGRPAGILALPPEGTWPPPDTLITRRELAELYGVTVEVIRAWERRGKGPPKVTNLQRGDFSPALYRCGEAKAWLEGMVVALGAAAAFAPPSPAEAIIDDRAARKAKAIAHVRQLEGQLIEIEGAQNLGSSWCALDEGDEAFASNAIKRSRPAGYWGSR
jgi:DNA-binding transcriptional MerR regulator